MMMVNLFAEIVVILLLDDNKINLLKANWWFVQGIVIN